MVNKSVDEHYSTPEIDSLKEVHSEEMTAAQKLLLDFSLRSAGDEDDKEEPAEPSVTSESAASIPYSRATSVRSFSTVTSTIAPEVS